MSGHKSTMVCCALLVTMDLQLLVEDLLRWNREARCLHSCTSPMTWLAQMRTCLLFMPTDTSGVSRRY